MINEKKLKISKKMDQEVVQANKIQNNQTVQILIIRVKILRTLIKLNLKYSLKMFKKYNNKISCSKYLKALSLKKVKKITRD